MANTPRYRTLFVIHLLDMGFLFNDDLACMTADCVSELVEMSVK